MEEPAAKRAKVDGAAQETEEDAPEDSSPRIDGAVGFNVQDTTLNVMQSTCGNILMPLTDGGLQFLLAGARANRGMKAGRYSFEVKILQLLTGVEEGVKTKTPQPRQYLRVGVSTSSSSLLIGDAEDSICFDSIGSLCHNGTKKPCGRPFGLHSVVTVVLNLDIASPNANTISLFKDGARVCEPQKLPESLIGKPLFPAITFRNFSLHYNFGPQLLAPLSFNCRPLSDAAKSQVEPRPAAVKKGGKHEVLFPVCVPDEGTFDWLDMFLKDNPHYTELSDRALLAWAEKSGLERTKKAIENRGSNDKPEAGCNIAAIDDGTTRKILYSIAPLQKRDYVIMEVKDNLVADSRSAQLERWPTHTFKRIAAVMMADPPPEFRRVLQAQLLKEKQAKSDEEFRARKSKEKKQREMEKRQKKIESDKKRVLRRQKRAAEEAKRKLAIAKKEKEFAARGEEYDPDKDEDLPALTEEKEEEVMMEIEDVDPPDEDPPAVTLTEEEKRVTFRTPTIRDLTSYNLNTSFMKFSLPGDNEGFDSVRYDWANDDGCKAHLVAWVQEKKNTTRVEDLQPGDWFNGRWKEWQKTLAAWVTSHKQFKAAVTARAAEKAKKVAAAKAKAAKAKAEADKKAKEEAERKAKLAAAGGEDAAEEAETKEGEGGAIKPPGEEAKEEEGEKEEELGCPTFDKLDVYGVDNVVDVGGGEPLFSKFAFEDWAMLSLRFEITLLVHSFSRDVEASGRSGVHVDHLPFYYTKYFKKPLNLKFYGVETVPELLGQIRDTVVISKKGKLVLVQVPDDIESFGIFAMLTEESRRDRIMRVDMGDDTARLKVKDPAAAGAAAAAASAASAAAAAAAAANVGAISPGAVAPSKVAPGAGVTGAGQLIAPAGAQVAGGIRPMLTPRASAGGAGDWNANAAAWGGAPAVWGQQQQWW